MRGCSVAREAAKVRVESSRMQQITLQSDAMTEKYDALLLVSFGGPEGPEDVIPFLENVLRGRNVPRGRMLEVAVSITSTSAA